MKKRDVFLMAAVAGMLGAATPSPAAPAEEKKTEVRCWGVNSCEGKGAVTEADLKAFKDLLGAKEYETRFGMSETHDCAGKGKCGVKDRVLNWEPTSAADCKARGGYLVEEVGPEKKKVARKG
jgi:hypothetical protein